MEDKKAIEQPNYTPDEILYRSMIIERMNDAREQREQPYTEFDDMTFKQYWESNAKAANSYIRPKVNKEDVRTTSGTTHEKTGTLLSSLLNYNLEPDIEAYDNDDIIVAELGTLAEDMIKKSRKIEKPDYEVKRPLIYKDGLDQGTWFVEDAQVEFSLPDKVADNFNVSDIAKMTWGERMNKVYKFCAANLLNSLDVYLGNIREFYMENQPYIVVRQVITRAEAEARYGTWERWKNVPRKLTQTAEDGSTAIPYNNWSMEAVEKGKTEIIRYMCKWDNDLMVMINGVMMFPVRRNKKGRLATFPLSSLNGECEYPIAKGDIEPISKHFAYSKSIPAKTKVNQALFDEMLLAIVLKTRKSYKPPMANNTGKALSKKIFYPGNITTGINPEKLQEIGENRGVTSSEFSVVEFIKQIINENSVSNIFEGQQGKGQQTAREVTILKQQSMMKLGVAILGIVNFEKRLCKLRLNNIIKYWTEPIDKGITELRDGIETTVNKYKSLSIDTQFDSGQRGSRIINFTEDELPTTGQVDAEEKLLSMLNNKEYRIHYVNPTVLRNVDYNWYIEMVPTEKNTSELKLAMFEETISKMMQLFAPYGKMPNLDYLATRWSTLAHEDPNKMFPQQDAQMMQQQMMQPREGGEIASQMAPQPEQKPSLNTMIQG